MSIKICMDKVGCKPVCRTVEGTQVGELFTKVAGSRDSNGQPLYIYRRRCDNGSFAIERFETAASSYGPDMRNRTSLFSVAALGKNQSIEPFEGSIILSND